MSFANVTACCAPAGAAVYATTARRMGSSRSVFVIKALRLGFRTPVRGNVARGRELWAANFTCSEVEQQPQAKHPALQNVAGFPETSAKLLVFRQHHVAVQRVEHGNLRLNVPPA